MRLPTPASSEIRANTTDDDIPDDVIEMASRMLEVLLNRGVNAGDALARVARMPPFSDYPALPDLISGSDSESVNHDRKR